MIDRQVKLSFTEVYGSGNFREVWEEVSVLMYFVVDTETNLVLNTFNLERLRLLISRQFWI